MGGFGQSEGTKGMGPSTVFKIFATSQGGSVCPVVRNVKADPTDVKYNPNAAFSLRVSSDS